MPETTTGPTWMVGDDTFAGQTPGRYLTCPDCGQQDAFRVQLDDHDNLIIKCSGHGRTAREPDLHVDMWEARTPLPEPVLAERRTVESYRAEVEERLADTYTAEGIAIWRRSKSRNLHGFTPDELIGVAADPRADLKAWDLLRDELDRVTGGMG